MNKKNIGKHLFWKLNDWFRTIKDEELKKAIKKDVIVTGGAFVSLLNGEEPNDYDVYFKTKETLVRVIEYYIKEWRGVRTSHNIKIINSKDRVKVRVVSAGVLKERNKDYADASPRSKYRPVFISANAITLSDKIQIVTRFFGSIEDIHKNYDFTHTICSFDYFTREVNLPPEALECIINKELFYQGSKYPLASIIRTRKFIKRGWTINAGQYLKMALQLNELDLWDLETLEDQLTGVDSVYFGVVLKKLKACKNENNTLDDTRFFEIINDVF